LKFGGPKKGRDFLIRERKNFGNDNTCYGFIACFKPSSKAKNPEAKSKPPTKLSRNVSLLCPRDLQLKFRCDKENLFSRYKTEAKILLKKVINFTNDVETEKYKMTDNLTVFFCVFWDLGA